MGAGVVGLAVVGRRWTGRRWKEKRKPLSRRGEKGGGGINLWAEEGAEDEIWRREKEVEEDNVSGGRGGDWKFRDPNEEGWGWGRGRGG